MSYWVMRPWHMVDRSQIAGPYKTYADAHVARLPLEAMGVVPKFSSIYSTTDIRRNPAIHKMLQELGVEI